MLAGLRGPKKSSPIKKDPLKIPTRIKPHTMMTSPTNKVELSYFFLISRSHSYRSHGQVHAPPDAINSLI
jgi:hypothetical protein